MLAWNLRPSCLSLPNAGIEAVQLLFLLLFFLLLFPPPPPLPPFPLCIFLFPPSSFPSSLSLLSGMCGIFKQKGPPQSLPSRAKVWACSCGDRKHRFGLSGSESGGEGAASSQCVFLKLKRKASGISTVDEGHTLQFRRQHLSFN